ncbi:hypothetical protein J6590_086967 [Homalodisca vitripennis]|nr:hypothetical protein J6590_086967 [Homalodisca vitripennis]
MDTKANVDNETPSIHSEHVKEEFYKWFESRGLLSDLRAYMRQLMVKALEESNKNGKTVRPSKEATSPKLQAINLLMVDYLFHEDYLYTVSVFASESLKFNTSLMVDYLFHEDYLYTVSVFASEVRSLKFNTSLMVDYLFHEDYLYTVSVFASEVRSLKFNTSLMVDYLFHEDYLYTVSVFASEVRSLKFNTSLMVDYLFHEDYLYTVSVFASEVRSLKFNTSLMVDYLFHEDYLYTVSVFASESLKFNTSLMVDYLFHEDYLYTVSVFASESLKFNTSLMVDFLFHEDYLYTVSVFASEAQILDSLPQYSSYVTQTVRERRLEPSSLPRFSQQETEDILDTLRLPPTRQAARQATQLYLSGHESLFTCVVRTLTSSGLDQEVAMRGAEVDQDVLSVGCSHQLWSQEMENLLLLAGVKLQHIRRMQHKWAQIIEEERMIVRQEEEAQRMEWERDIEQRVRVEVMEQLRERQSTVELREQGLTNLAEQLTAVHDDINDRLSQLQVLSDNSAKF